MTSITHSLHSMKLNKPFWLTLLVISPILLLPVSRSAELPVAIMAIWGLIRLVQNSRQLYILPSVRHFSLLYVLIWLPIIISYPDSAAPDQTLRVGLGYVRFYLAGIFIIDMFDRYPLAPHVIRALSWFLLLLLVDALIQFILGFNILGFPYDGNRINGLFGEDLKLGSTIALLAPFMLIHIQKKSWQLKGIIWSLLILITLLTGSRASWVMVALSFAGLFIIQLNDNRHTALRFLLVICIALPASTLVIYHGSNYVKQRIDQTLQLFSTDTDSIDYALSYRLPIWSNALDMIKDKPINGIGVRSFRDVYFDYASTDDFFRTKKIVPTHIHQMVLEVGAETGGVGLLGLAAFFFFLIKRIFRSGSRSKYSTAYMIGALVATFPLNTHLALYSSFWGMIFWWLLAQHCATLSYTEKSLHK